MNFNNKQEAINYLIRHRRAIYPQMFIEKPIEKEVLMELLENANHAPTHRLTEPWRFKIISGDKKTELGQLLADWYKANTAAEKFSESKYQKTQLKSQQSALVLAICMQRDLKESLPEWEEMASMAMAVQNLWLSAAAYDIGAYWSSPKSIHSPEMAQFLQLGEGESCWGIFYMGYYNPVELVAKRSPIEDKVVFL